MNRFPPHSKSMGEAYPALSTSGMGGSHRVTAKLVLAQETQRFTCPNGVTGLLVEGGRKTLLSPWGHEKSGPVYEQALTHTPIDILRIKTFQVRRRPIVRFPCSASRQTTRP